MKITVRLFATLVNFVPEAIAAQYPQGIRAGQSFEMELREGSTLADLVAHLALPSDQTKVAFVNARARALDYRLEAGDEVGIFPPIGGGQ